MGVGESGGGGGGAEESAASNSGLVDPSFWALYGRLMFTVRRHKLNKDSPSTGPAGYTPATGPSGPGGARTGTHSFRALYGRLKCTKCTVRRHKLNNDSP